MGFLESGSFIHAGSRNPRVALLGCRIDQRFIKKAGSSFFPDIGHELENILRRGKCVGRVMLLYGISYRAQLRVKIYAKCGLIKLESKGRIMIDHTRFFKRT